MTTVTTCVAQLILGAFLRLSMRPGLARSQWDSSGSPDEPTARGVMEHFLCGAINMLTGPGSPSTCLWVRCALSTGHDGLRKEFATQRAAGDALLRKRFQRAIRDGDLPADIDATELAQQVLMVNYGMTIQTSTGATRKDLERIANAVLRDWPRRPPPALAHD